MTTPPTPTPDSPAPSGISRVRTWLDDRFRTAPAVYGLIVFTAFIIIGADKEDHIDDVLAESVLTLLVFYIAHVFAHALTAKGKTTRAAVGYYLRHASGMLYASIPSMLVLIIGGVAGVPVDQAVWYAVAVAVVMLGILGFAAYSKPGTHIVRRILGAFGAAALGLLVILLEYTFH